MKTYGFTYENCSNGDTNEQQMLINLGTKSEAKANRIIRRLVRIFNGEEKILNKKGDKNGKL